MGTLYAHYSDVDPNDWPWQFFQPWEIASRGDGSLLVVPEFLDGLTVVRHITGKPVVVNSAYRDPMHNARVGGVPLSCHPLGIAGDLDLTGHNRMELLAACKEAGFTGFGGYSSFLHADMGRPRKWGQKWVF